MGKRPRNHSRFDVGEWAQQAAKRRKSLVEVNQTIAGIKEEIESSKENVKILEDQNTKRNEQINKLKRKVCSCFSLPFHPRRRGAVSGVSKSFGMGRNFWH